MCYVYRYRQCEYKNQHLHDNSHWVVKLSGGKRIQAFLISSA